MPAREAYETLAKMANLRVRYHLKPPPENRRVTLTCIHEPLWEAMARVAAGPEPVQRLACQSYVLA